MPRKLPAARDHFRLQSPDFYWMDHVSFGLEDLERFEHARGLTMWAVDVAAGALERLPNLRYLDFRSSSQSDLEFCLGCAELRMLRLNGMRKLTSLDGLERLTKLIYLDFYALSQIELLPDLSELTSVYCLGIGQMRRLKSLAPCWDIPNLVTLKLCNVLPIEETDFDQIDKMQSLREISLWFENPKRNVVERLYALRPKAPGEFPYEWFARHGLDTELGE